MGETLPILSIDQDRIPVHPDAAHEWTMPTADVARGYGVGVAAIRNQKMRREDELIEGIHWGVTNCDTLGGQQDAIQWTKLGVITLGFFLRSERAKHFRAAAAKLVISVTTPPAPSRPERPGFLRSDEKPTLRRRGPPPGSDLSDKYVRLQPLAPRRVADLQHFTMDERMFFLEFRQQRIENQLDLLSQGIWPSDV